MPEQFSESDRPSEKQASLDPGLAQVYKELNSPASRTVGQRLRDEIDLLAHMPMDAGSKAVEHISKNPLSVGEQVLIGAAFGATIACAVKNPAVFGKTLSRGIMNTAEHSAPVFAGMAGLDWSYRVGAPMADLWQHGNMYNAREKMGTNVGSGVVDYTAGAIGGVLGAKAAWSLTPEWVNVAPAFDRTPSVTLGEKPRVYDGDASKLKTVKENVIADDVKDLYEKAFPIEERQPLPEVQELMDKGRIITHTTRDADGNLQGFSFTSMHDETSTKFANLDFIAIPEEARSKGMGSEHFNRLRKLIGEEHPELSALTLEMEHPKEPGIDDSVRALREFRSKFYDRLDTPDTNVKFMIFDFEDPTYRGPAQWRAWAYKPEEFNAVKTARTMCMDEGGYGLAKNSIQIKEFDRANNYWEPQYGAGRSGLYGGVVSGNKILDLLRK